MTSLAVVAIVHADKIGFQPRPARGFFDSFFLNGPESRGVHGHARLHRSDGFGHRLFGQLFRFKLFELELEEFETEELAKKAVTKTVTTMESRVAMYATAFWTVEEKAVKESSRGSGLKANFVGVDDGDNCQGCQSAIDGNPWVAESVPSPGEQDCLGNCRHAIQFVTDEDLTSAEVLELAESEKMFRDGVKLLGDE